MTVADKDNRFTVALPKRYSDMTPDERRQVALQIANAAKDMAAKVKSGGDAAK
jgi:hypothetical protein